MFKKKVDLKSKRTWQWVVTRLARIQVMVSNTWEATYPARLRKQHECATVEKIWGGTTVKVQPNLGWL